MNIILISILFSFLISATIAIDTLGLIMKSSGDRNQTASAFTGANILSYISRASVIILMPLLGLILDRKVEINFEMLLASLLILNLFFVVISLAGFNDISQISNKSIKDIQKGLLPFIKSYFQIFKIKLNFSSTFSSKPILPLILVYSIQYSIFPIIISLGFIFNDFKSTAISLYGAITGIFTLYLVLVVERKFAIKIDSSQLESQSYCKNIITSKLLSCSLVLPCIFIFLYANFPSFPK